MRPETVKRQRDLGGGFLWDLLTFDRLLTGPLIHLIYWAGLGVIALLGFFVLGAAVGLALREDSWAGLLLALDRAGACMIHDREAGAGG